MNKKVEEAVKAMLKSHEESHNRVQRRLSEEKRAELVDKLWPRQSGYKKGKSNPTAAQCLRSAKMLVPKFSYEHEGMWHIHWPKDQSRVIHATSKEKLIPTLAEWLKEIGRVDNKGLHVQPDYPEQ